MIKNRFVVVAALLLLWSVLAVPVAFGASAADIDARVDKTLEKLKDEVKGSEKVMDGAKGVLVFPGVVKAGIGVGGETGEGALRIDGKTVDYYRISAASVGLQVGAQKKDIIIVFRSDASLKKFRDSKGFKIGTDMSIALAKTGKDRSLDTTSVNGNVVGFVIGQKGLMVNRTLEGSKITKIDKPK